MPARGRAPLRGGGAQERGGGPGAAFRPAAGAPLQARCDGETRQVFFRTRQARKWGAEAAHSSGGAFSLDPFSAQACLRTLALD